MNHCRHCGAPVDIDTFVCDPCYLVATAPFEFPEQDAVKSSTSVMKAGVCQTCGCKMDGVKGGGKIGCTCVCHKGA
jgi:hypothetical protein